MDILALNPTNVLAVFLSLVFLALNLLYPDEKLHFSNNLKSKVFIAKIVILAAMLVNVYQHYSMYSLLFFAEALVISTFIIFFVFSPQSYFYSISLILLVCAVFSLSVKIYWLAEHCGNVIFVLLVCGIVKNLTQIDKGDKDET